MLKHISLVLGLLAMSSPAMAWDDDDYRYHERHHEHVPSNPQFYPGGPSTREEYRDRDGFNHNCRRHCFGFTCTTECD